MRILYIDIDSLRPDHLGCYGYHRNTSPNIDKIAASGVLFENLYVSDAPCLPSRTALISGRFGIHNGVVNHGGVAADMKSEGIGRGFESTLGQTSLPACLRRAGLTTTTISSFGERHSAWQWYANFNEIFNPGERGMDTADQVAPMAIDWIERNASRDNWFLHVNMWDPHTPYRAPQEYIDRFADEPLPAWLTEEVRQQHWQGCGPHSAQETNGYDDQAAVFEGDYPQQPPVINSMDAVRMMFDGYDAGVAYADYYVGEIVKSLKAAGIFEETVILIGADHGECLGELNAYGDHQYADQATCRVPWIVRWPSLTDSQAGRVDRDLYYQIDFSATLVELLGQEVPENWDGQSFAKALSAGDSGGREQLILSQSAWSCQRSVRFRKDQHEMLAIRSYHDGHHGFPEWMLFDLTDDPHQQTNLAEQQPELIEQLAAVLVSWKEEMLASDHQGTDPMDTVQAEGGPFHTRGYLAPYVARLRATGRGEWADLLEARHG